MKKSKSSATTLRKKASGKKASAKKASAKKAPLSVTLGEALRLGEHLKAKHRLGTEGKPVTEVDSRDEIDWDSGRMSRRDQFFDRQNDHTKEVVTFQDTGEVKFSKEGKLSEKNKPR